MSTDLEFRLANDEERLAAFENVHEFWGRGRTLEDHIALRLASPQHRRAQWCVGCLGDRVVVSLGSYPLEFHFQDRVVPGMAIGAVHTVPACRRRGFARRLIEWAEQRCRAAGVWLSMLYSDIDPAYYASMGYLTCPANEGWAPPEGNSRGSGWRLVECDPEPAVSELAACYVDYHGNRPIAVARNDQYWRYLLDKWPDNEFFWLEDRAGTRHGYVRLATEQDTLRIVDYACCSGQEVLDELYREVSRRAVERSITKVGGWLPDCAVARCWFPIATRKREITMMKPLDSAVELDVDTLAAADFFCEIDHV